MSQPFEPDQICIADLFALKSEIDSFVNSYCSQEESFCEGSDEYSELKRLTEAKAARLRGRIRGLAIDWGIHREFIEQYELSRKNGLKSVA
jgi:hypothetical protein